MKKVETSDGLRPLYTREDFGKGIRGKHFGAYRKGTNLVLLSPDVAKVFPTDEAVNEALRSLNQGKDHGIAPPRSKTFIDLPLVPRQCFLFYCLFPAGST